MSDLVTFGETMLRLSPPDSRRIDQSGTLETYVAGAESNVAIAAQRLGLEATWLSKLPDNVLGRSVASRVAEHGVTVDVVWTDEGRQGLYFVEQAPEPRGTNVLYDRVEAPIRTATPNELAVEHVADADWVFTTGITPALSDRLARTTGQLLAHASDTGATVAFDVNYRSKLWSTEAAANTLEELLPLVDTLVVAKRDAEDVLGLDPDPVTQANTLVAEYDLETAVVTRGEEGALALHDGTIHERDAYDVDTVDAIGSGDALVGGFLARRAAGGDVDEALTYGSATAALKRTVPGDVARVTREEVDRLVETGSANESR